MWNQELLSTAITVCGEVQGHNAIPEKEIVLEFLPQQLSDVKAIGYNCEPHPILRCPSEAIQSRPVRQILPSQKNRHFR